MDCIHEDPKVHEIMDMLDQMDEETSIQLCARYLLYLSSSSRRTCVEETEDRQCQVCLKKKTPLWRRNEQYHTLCNACGIRLRTKGKSKIHVYLQ